MWKIFLGDPIITGWIAAQVNSSHSSHETFLWEMESWGLNAWRSSIQIFDLTGMKAWGHCTMVCQAGFWGQEVLWRDIAPWGCPQSPWRSLGFVSLAHTRCWKYLKSVSSSYRETLIMFENGNVSSFPPSICNLVCACLFMLMAESRDYLCCLQSITSSVSCPKT